MIKMERKDGQYYYAPRRGLWGIWQWHDLGDGYGSGTFVKDCMTKKAAREEVYRLNGWEEKK